MNRRTARCTTGQRWLHPIFAVLLLTIGLRAQAAPGAATPGDAVTISAVQQQKQGEVYRLKGDVRIDFRDFVLQADEITYDGATGQATATGHIVLDGGPHDEHVEAASGEYNLRTQTGTFHEVTGSTGARIRGRNVTLTTDSPFLFTGKTVEKTSPTHFVVHHGTVTSCGLPQPKWTFNAQRVEVEVGGTARIYNSTFRIRQLPVLYLPFAAHPVNKPKRESGFLIPTFGVSSRKGTILGESFYWAINRSLDATLGAEFYSSRGWAQHGEFRARPSSSSSLDLTYFGVLDRGFGTPRQDQGGQDIKLAGEAQFPGGIRGVIAANYLSSFLFRLAFTENYAQAVNSEVKSLGFLTKNFNGYSWNTSAARYQNFQSATQGDVITIARAPSMEFGSVERRIFQTPFYFAFATALEGVTRREPTFKTNDIVGRFDMNPRASLPIFFHGWTLRGEIGMRDTYYTQRKAAAPGFGTPLDEDLNRRVIEASAELRPPTLGRIFAKPLFGRTVKHTIEPRVSYHVVNGVSGFQNIIRFDARDILSDTSELEYGLIQRIYLKPVAGQPCDPAAKPPCASPREFISWEVLNRYYFDPHFGAAVVDGRRNVLSTTADLTGIAFLTTPRRFSPVISKLRVNATMNTDISWQLDYDPRRGWINGSNLYVGHRWNDFFIGGSHVMFHAAGELFVLTPTLPAPDRFNQFRVQLGYGTPSKRGISASTTIGFDANREFLQYGSFQSSYNWDCCGLTMEYRRFALGTVRNENQFRFAFTLANIGTFGNLKRQERIY